MTRWEYARLEYKSAGTLGTDKWMDWDAIFHHPGGVERATGGTAIPSSYAGTTYTNLTGPVYYEVASADVGTGTIILNAPSGFIFDTGGTAPTVVITRLTGPAPKVRGETETRSLEIDAVSTIGDGFAFRAAREQRGRHEIPAVDLPYRGFGEFDTAHPLDPGAEQLALSW